MNREKYWNKWRTIEGNWFYQLRELYTYPETVYHIRKRGGSIIHHSIDKKYILKRWNRYKYAKSFKTQYCNLLKIWR